MGVTGYPMLKVVADFAPKECFRMCMAWDEWNIPEWQQMAWVKEIGEVFMIGVKAQKASSMGFHYSHNKQVAQMKASQRRANDKLIRARRAVIKHRMDKGRKTIAEIEEAIVVKA